MCIRDRKVLLVDADPQGDLTTCLGWRDNDSLTTTITDKLSGVIREDHSDPQSGILHHEENVDLLPANSELSAMEMMLVTAMSRETILRSYLSKVKDNYDYVLIDCMPSLGLSLIHIYCIRTIGDLAKTDPDFLNRRLGKNGIALWQDVYKRQHQGGS